MGILAEPREQGSVTAILELADIAQLRRFTREEFYAMDRAGIFDRDYGVELVDGRIITRMAPIGGEHAWSVENLTRALIISVNDTAYSVRVQCGISLPGDRELQPDFVVYKPRPENTRQNPEPSQVALIIEVSDTSLRYDRTEKMQMYASVNIPVYWIVDVRHKRVSVYTQPEDGVYSHLEQFSGDDNLTVCGRDFEVAGIF